MREALSRLSAERLVQQTDNRGFTLIPVSVAELVDLTQARCWLNEVALRQSIQRGGSAWEEAVLLSFHRLSRTPRRSGADPAERSPSWEAVHRAFHRSLVEGCGSHWLVDFCERLFDAAERYRHLARRAGVTRGNAEDEHKDIMQAAVDRKADEAVDLLNMHFMRTAELVQKVIAKGEHDNSQADTVGPGTKPRHRRIDTTRNPN
jgi:GntR family carbon starvation induced transcriptional regulator